MAQTIRTYVTPHPTGGSGALDVEVIPDGPGTVSFSTVGWSPGTYTITCTRQPDGDSESAASNAISWTLNAAAPSGPSILSTTVVQNTTAGRNVAVTVASIPANALVVMLCTTTGYIGANGTASGTNVGSLTRQRRYPDSGGAGTTEIFTLRNGATPRANEVVTYTNGDTGATETSCAAVLVIDTASNTFAFTDGGSAGTAVTSFNFSHAATGAGSLLLAVMKIAPDGAVTRSITPSTGTTELGEAASNPGATGSLRSHIWVGRVDGLVSTPASGAVAGTIDGIDCAWCGTMMEIAG